MKKTTGILLIIGIMTLSLAMEIRPEVIFLKDGSLVQGSVTQDAAEYITVRKEDNKTEKILRKDIMRILYTKLNMGKIYVQKRDGKGLTAFIVDEDQESYTFRKELHSPAEFTLKRVDVLFIADRNPSGLKGEAETDRARLEWFPSYDPMKRYHVYIKKKGETFALADSSKKPAIVLHGLSSNTEYVVRVTGVDMEEAETTPSNEFKFLTKNVPPGRPGKLVKHQEPGGATVISWDAAVDGDGKVTGYRLYAKVKGKRALVGETGKTTYSVQDAPRYKRVEVTAVDERGDESAGAAIRLVPMGISMNLSPGLLYPMGTFGEMGAVGYGGLISFMMNDIIIRLFSVGMEGGYYYLPGKDAIETEAQKTHRLQIIPFFIKLQYHQKLYKQLYLAPSLSIGGAYVDLTYITREKSTLLDNEKKSSAIEPCANISLSLEYALPKSLLIGIQGGYGMIFEREYLQFMHGAVIIGMRI